MAIRKRSNSRSRSRNSSRSNRSSKSRSRSRSRSVESRSRSTNSRRSEREIENHVAKPEIKAVDENQIEKARGDTIHADTDETDYYYNQALKSTNKGI